MSASERTGWECRFCSEQLRSESPVGWRRLLWIVPVRTFRCPHCFHTFLKPVESVAAIPVVGKLFCEKHGVSATVSELISRVFKRHENSNIGGEKRYVNAGWVVRFGRWTENMELRVSDYFSRTFRPLWLGCLWPFHWFSKKFLGSAGNAHLSFPPKSRKLNRSV